MKNKSCSPGSGDIFEYEITQRDSFSSWDQVNWDQYHSNENMDSDNEDGKISNSMLMETNNLVGPQRFSYMFQWMYQMYNGQDIKPTKAEDFVSECLELISSHSTSQQYQILNQFLTSYKGDSKILDGWAAKMGDNRDLYFDFYSIFLEKMIEWISETCPKDEDNFLKFYAKIWNNFLEGCSNIDADYMRFYTNILRYSLHASDTFETGAVLTQARHLWERTFFSRYCIVSVPLTIRSLMQREWDGEKFITRCIPSTNIINSYKSFGIHCKMDIFGSNKNPSPLELYEFFYWHTKEYPVIHRNRFITILVEGAILFMDTSDNDIKAIEESYKFKQKSQKLKEFNKRNCVKYRIKKKSQHQEKKRMLQNLSQRNEELRRSLDSLGKRIENLKLMHRK